jgi:hypothetical protein
MATKLFKDYFNEKVTDTVLPVNAKVLIQDGTGEPTQINAGSIGAGQLVKVTENGKTGYRLKDADPANYGNIGDDAVDLSISQSASTTKGAIGDYSHASGLSTGASGFASHAEGNSTEASGYASHAEGDTTTASEESAHAEGIGTIASGQASHAQGNETTASGFASHAEGVSTTASGSSSHAEGSSTFARSLAEHSGGVNGTDYTPQSATVFNLIDRLVNYGNGVDTNNRSDAYTLFKNGMQKFFTAALSTITNAVKGSVMLDENARMNIHDGSAFKAVAFSDEVDAKISGSGTTNQLAKFTASGAVGNSVITELANGNVGVGIALPVAGFQLANRDVFVFSGSNRRLLIGDTSGLGDYGGFRWQTSDNSLSFGHSNSSFDLRNILVNPNGNIILNAGIVANVGINQSNPTEKLDVVGNGKFSGTVSCGQFTTATEPAYVKGAQFFNTTLDKMRIGGATAYETVTSS